MPYLHVIRRPSVFRLLTGSWVGRLPSAMAALAIPLALRDSGASYGFVGLAAGTFAVSSALGAPVVGRWVDRRGQTAILAATALLAAVGFIAIAATPDREALVIIGAALAGAATPPLEPCLRALWPDLVPQKDLESAYALDSSAQELVFVAGPLVVAGTLAVATPTAVLWAQAVLGLVGVLIVVTAEPSRRWRPMARSADWLGPLRERGLVLLLVCLAGVGFAIGTLNILVVHYAEHRGFPGGAPALLALHAGGSLVGVLVYGARTWATPLPRRALVIALGLLSGYALLVLLPPAPLMAPLIVLTGLFLAPLLATTFMLVGDLAPTGTTTEAFAWLITLFAAGTSAGSAVTGGVLQRADEHWGAACGALGVTLTVTLLFLGRRQLHANKDVNAITAPAESV
ncbi:MFS transporter [Streptomyces resistomycificus]|uniref:MFS transporter n=1 Tax=Streptomyces resistomycificus TaxID=67356 RepID=A0A0L8LFY9_9ACTN|nr:MFS transporter [Streptomyces resistomycificus]KOG37040.1 MFS transporter [Streptomyces resistomycificus]KUN94985.1 MFS transporter [Streptomyces resistomycificus]